MLSKAVKFIGLVLIVFLVLAQFIRPDRSNPPENPASTFEAVAKPSPQVLSIVNRSCRDCHSHNTVWPWYSRVAPVSWLVADDVRDGRSHLNFSEWNLYSADMSKLKLKEVCNEVRKGDMPLRIYTVLHPDAKLSPGDVQTLCGAAGMP